MLGSSSGFYSEDRCRGKEKFGLFGAFILSKQGVRFRNAINSNLRSTAVDFPVGPLSSFVCKASRGSSLELSSLSSWLAIRFHPVLSSSIAVNSKLFMDLSSTIAMKECGFVSVSSSVKDWAVEIKTEDGCVFRLLDPPLSSDCLWISSS
jgi:hypothetical protein